MYGMTASSGGPEIRNPAKARCKPEQGQGVNQPFGRVEVIPQGSVPVVAGERVMVIVIALAESQQGDPPTVSTGIILAMRLAPPQMADGIDTEG